MPNPVRGRGRQVNAFQALALLLSFVLVAGIGGVVAAGLVLPGVAVASTATDTTVKAFNALPTDLETTTLPQKSTILAADGTLLATFYTENRVVVPLSQIAPIMQHAVIATEDKRFYEHGGVDPTGMLRAMVKNQIDSSATQGASTLTQQYVKNVLIEQAQQLPTKAEQQKAIAEARGASGTEGYARKLREAKLAITLEKSMTKDQILEQYLNIAQFGPSEYGVESAAEYYFQTTAKDLTYLQAATIAGITQSPTKWDPVQNPKDSQNRRDTVLGLMHAQGYITDTEYNQGLATPLASTLNVKPLKQGCMMAGDAVPGSGYFCDYVTKVLTNDPAFGATLADRRALLYRGGLTITTTLDKAQQTEADASVKEGVPVDDPSGLGSSIVSVEPGTGKITSMAQNRNYTAIQEHGPRDTSVNYNTDSAYGGANGFEPGSSFKPFTLLEWLKQGHSLSDQVDGTARTFDQAQFKKCGKRYGVGPWKVGNSEPGAGMMSVLTATADSVNAAYAAMGQQLDLCNIMQGAADLGVHLGTAKGGPPGAYPSNIIGTDQIAPMTMAAAYAAFASGGTFCTPIAITKVVDSTGKELPVPSANCHPAVDSKYTSAVTYALTHVWDGTAARVNPKPSFPTAGKTGTTNANEYTWFVGYTPRLATAVWVGFPQGKIPVQRIRIAGKYYQNVYGADIAAPTWVRFMNQALADGNNPDFTQVGLTELYGSQVPVPSVIGQPADAAKATLQGAGFQVAVSPQQISSSIPAGSVATQSPSGKATPGSTITLTLSNGQPPAGQGGGGPGDGGGGGGGGGGLGGGGGGPGPGPGGGGPHGGGGGGGGG
jgi:membrane peptidoglycan carboxypeptidase